MSQQSSSFTPLSSSGTQSMAALAETHGPVLSDDLYHVIRAFVPPPPPVETCPTTTGLTGTFNGHFDTLFTRRPTEKSLLEKLNGQLFSPNEALSNLEELFIQLVEPQKYSDVNVVMHTVSRLMLQWPNARLVQEQALQCLRSLSQQQGGDLQPSQAAVSTILRAMKVFEMNEKIQRLGVKLLKEKNFLSCVKHKVEVAHLVFHSLCKLPEVDDFMLHAKDIVVELNPPQRKDIRSCKLYVEMLLDFPNRKNDKITVYLCWAALDTLALLADLDEKWDSLISADGEARLHKLSCRPELVDRCTTLLKKVFFPENGNAPDNGNMAACNLTSTEPEDLTHPSPYERHKALDPLLNESSGTFDRCSPTVAINPKLPNHRKESNGQLSRLVRRTTSDLLPEGSSIIVLPVDELITKRPPTPPPTIADINDDLDGEFSDDEITHTMQSPFTPFGSLSPSYSPPPETYALLANRLGEPQNLNTSMEDGSGQARMKNNINNGIPSKTIVNVTIQNGSKHRSKSVSSRNSNYFSQCIFCNEPTGKQSLLSKQWKQISHCIQKPCNVLLFKCIESNLCEDHR